MFNLKCIEVAFISEDVFSISHFEEKEHIQLEMY
jgi:hypothetical protein